MQGTRSVWKLLCFWPYTSTTLRDTLLSSSYSSGPTFHHRGHLTDRPAPLLNYYIQKILFSAVLALNGRRGANNWLTCMKTPSHNLHGCSEIHNSCCVGSSYDENATKETKGSVSNFFTDYFCPFLIKPKAGQSSNNLSSYSAQSIYGDKQVTQHFLYT